MAQKIKTVVKNAEQLQSANAAVGNQPTHMISLN